MILMPNFINNTYGYARFYFSLKRFLETTLSEEEGKKAIAQRLREREENFLKLIRNTVFLNQRSPYLKLFKFFKITYADVQRLIGKNGLELALGLLKEEGIYLTIEEFKGKKPAVRGDFECLFKERDFDNHLLSAYYSIRTGGTRSSGTRTLLDLEYIAAKAAYYPLILNMHNLSDCRIGLWAPVPPLGAGILPLLHFAKTGKTVLKWFSPVKLDLKRKIGFKLMVKIAEETSIKLPYPEYAGFQDVCKVVDWIASAKASRNNILFLSFVSGAVRICEYARAKNLDISGVKFWVFGEPLTKTRYDIIRSCGCEIVPIYSFIELGSVGIGCNQRQSPEEVHFLKDSMALIQYEKNVSAFGTSVGSFLFSSILPSSPKILLNVENGDYGEITERPCGCALDGLGLCTHIRSIQSFEKLNVEGMTFFIFDFLSILEEVLPRKFGGSPFDYQVSEELSNGVAKLNLIISPDIHIVDEDHVKQEVLNALEKRSLHGKNMVEILRQAGSLQIKREYPALTRAGKIYPLSLSKYK